MRFRLTLTRRRDAPLVQAQVQRVVSAHQGMLACKMWDDLLQPEKTLLLDSVQFRAGASLDVQVLQLSEALAAIYTQDADWWVCPSHRLKAADAAFLATRAIHTSNKYMCSPYSSHGTYGDSIHSKISE